MRAFFFALFGAVCWGIAPAFGKIGLKGVHPMDGLTARTMITVFLVGTWAFFSGSVSRIHTITLKGWIFLAVEAFLATFAGDLAYYAAIKWGHIGEVSLVLSISPLITLFIGCWLMGESLSLMKLLGAVFIVAGLVLVSWNAT